MPCQLATSAVSQAETSVVSLKNIVIGDDAIDWLGQIVVGVKTGIEKSDSDAATGVTFIRVHPDRHRQRLLDYFGCASTDCTDYTICSKLRCLRNYLCNLWIHNLVALKEIL